MKTYRIKHKGKDLYFGKGMIFGFYSDEYITAHLNYPGSHYKRLEPLIAEHTRVPRDKARIWTDAKAITRKRNSAKKERYFNIITDNATDSMTEGEVKVHLMKYGVPQVVGIEYLSEEGTTFSHFEVEIDDNGKVYTVSMDAFSVNS